MKTDDDEENRDVTENPSLGNEPFRIAWAYIHAVNPVREQQADFPYLLRPENDHLLWGLFDAMVQPKTQWQVTAENREDYRQFLSEHTHIAERQKEE